MGGKQPAQATWSAVASPLFPRLTDLFGDPFNPVLPISEIRFLSTELHKLGQLTSLAKYYTAHVGTIVIFFFSCTTTSYTVSFFEWKENKLQLHLLWSSKNTLSISMVSSICTDKKLKAKRSCFTCLERLWFSHGLHQRKQREEKEIQKRISIRCTSTYGVSSQDAIVECMVTTSQILVTIALFHQHTAITLRWMPIMSFIAPTCLARAKSNPTKIWLAHI